MAASIRSAANMAHAKYYIKHTNCNSDTPASDMSGGNGIACIEQQGEQVAMFNSYPAAVTIYKLLDISDAHIFESGYYRQYSLNDPERKNQKEDNGWCYKITNSKNNFTCDKDYCFCYTPLSVMGIYTKGK